MTSFKMLLFFFLHLIKDSQRNVNMSHYDYIFFPYISSDFCFMYLCSFVVRCLMVYSIFFMNCIFYHERYSSLFHLKLNKLKIKLWFSYEKY